MKPLTLEELKQLSSQLPEKIPYLKMLILFGSQARGDTHANSDWDFAALYDETLRNQICQKRAFSWWEVSSILGDIFNLNSDQIDVIDLNLCDPLMAHRIAQEGQLIYEQEEGLFNHFYRQSLLSQKELTKIRQTLRQNIESFLDNWETVFRLNPVIPKNILFNL